MKLLHDFSNSLIPTWPANDTLMDIVATWWSKLNTLAWWMRDPPSDSDWRWLIGTITPVCTLKNYLYEYYLYIIFMHTWLRLFEIIDKVNLAFKYPAFYYRSVFFHEVTDNYYRGMRLSLHNRPCFYSTKNLSENSSIIIKATWACV